MTRRKNVKFSTCLYATTALGLIMASAAIAQQAPETGIQEIIVTAQKRASTVQDTPISITAVSGEDLQDRGITDFSALAAATPGISMKTNGPGQTEFEMRGMTSSGGNSPTVGFYLDDVPLTAPAAAQNGKVVIDPTLYDLNRVEVLRGPQGTLYGSGSMGGTIKLITNQPNLSQYQASAESILSGTDGGGFNHNDNFMINLPLIKDQLALRVVGSEASTSGWIDRIVVGNFPLPTNGGNTRGNVLAAPVLSDDKGSNAEQLYGTRITVTWKPIENLTITPSVFYQKISQNGPTVYDSVPGTTLAHYEPFNVPEPYSDLVTLYSLTANYSFKAFDLTSVTSKWRRESIQTQDGSENFENPGNGIANSGVYYGPNGTGLIQGTEIDPSQQWSEEFRASSNGDGPLKWVGGVFYSDFKSNWELFTNVPNPGAFFSPTATVWTLYQPTEIKQTAVFGEATYAITDELKLTGGLRWFTYRNELNMSFGGFGSPSGTDTPILTNVVESHTGLNPKIDLSYEPDKDLLLYTTAAKGFRPGGGNQPIPGFSSTSPIGAFCGASLQSLGYNNAPAAYGPDSLWSYEAGEKAKLFNNHLSVNGSVFYENWYKVQLEELPCGYPVFDNAGTAHIWGGELEVKAALAEGLTVAASGGHTHAALSQGEHGWTPGNLLPDVPNWTGSVNITYNYSLSDKYLLTSRLENVYTGPRVDLTFPGGIPYTQTGLPSYDLTNLRAGVQSEDGWSATLFANNLFNKHAALENMTQLTLPNPSYNRVATNQPLTIGLDLTYRY